MSIMCIDGSAVDSVVNSISVTDAFNPSPFAQSAFDVVLAARVDGFLKIRIVERPPELSVGEDTRVAAFLPSRPLIGAEHGFSGQCNRHHRAVFVLTPDNDQVAHAPLGELAFNARHPHPA